MADCGDAMLPNAEDLLRYHKQLYPTVIEEQEFREAKAKYRL